MAFFPPKILNFTVQEIYDHEYWSDPSNPGVWEGSAFRWNARLLVQAQNHSSADTPTPFYYNGYDVKVGDWLADGGGNSLQIIEIISQDDSFVQCIIEDIDRYNTFRDPYVSGFGGLNSVDGFIFELAEDGSPILQGLGQGLYASEVVDSIQGRFVKRNIKTEFVSIKQTNHGFTIGDFIKVDEDNDGRFELVDQAGSNFAIGVVTSIGFPGTDWFSYKPLGKLLDNIEPPLVGNYGDIFYLDPANPGKVTNVKPLVGAKPVYVRLDSPNRAFLLNVSVDEDTNNKIFTVAATLDQTEFTMPETALDVQVMSINGIENTNFTFDPVSKVLTFDPVATGYGVDETDEIFFVYLS